VHVLAIVGLLRAGWDAWVFSAGERRGTTPGLGDVVAIESVAWLVLLAGAFAPTFPQEDLMLRFALAVAALAAALTGPARAEPAPAIDVVLCLDVSSSMDDLLDSARAKLWDLVNDIGKVKPTPKLRVGLYSYGHNGYDAKKGWVRREIDLTDDLDTVYKRLCALRTAGRGSEEYVARVCRDALAEQPWSADKRALKLIFVCGNEPADQDKEVPLDSVARSAVGKDVVINTIHCNWGSAQAGEVEGWQNLARRAEGRFAQIDRGGARAAVAAPQDRKLAELSVKLSTTYVAYGLKEVREARAENQAEQDANAARAGAAPARAFSKATALYRNSDWDLVDRLKDDPKFDVAKVPENQLPEELKKLKPAERVAHVKKKLAQREALQKEITDLSRQRDDHLKQAAKKDAKVADKAFDQALRAALRDQAKKKGIAVPE
jgi:hypothetical protein